MDDHDFGVVCVDETAEGDQFNVDQVVLSHPAEGAFTASTEAPADQSARVTFPTNVDAASRIRRSVDTHNTGDRAGQIGSCVDAVSVLSRSIALPRDGWSTTEEKPR